MFKLNILIKRNFTSIVKSLKDIPNLIKKNLPINLDKKYFHFQDQNLETFIPLHKIVNKVKFVSISKNFLDNLLSNKSLSDICESSLLEKIDNGIEMLNIYNQNQDTGIKFKLSFNNDLRKVQFLVNLYNIKNYVLIGIEPRKKNLNLKLINYYRDIYLQNPVIETGIRCDIAVNRKLNSMSIENENHFIYLISQFEYSLIPSKNESFKLLIDLEDEFNIKNERHDYIINSIEFKLENVLSKISIKEYLNDKSKNNLNDSNINAEFIMKYLANKELLDNRFMIVDVDNIMQGNNII
jgi:hypothetical protein